jgi:nitroreductase
MSNMTARSLQRTESGAATVVPVHTEIPSLVATLIQSRQTILPKRLFEPGPNSQQLAQIFEAAAAAPDHGQLVPWRFIHITESARPLLAEVFAQALLERDTDATSAQVEQAREKAFRAPLLLLAVVDGACGDTSIDLQERIVSAGCAIQNMLLMATALGFGSALTSGKALRSQGLRQLFALTASDHALCFVSVGTAAQRKSERVRPVPRDYVTQLSATGISTLD